MANEVYNTNEVDFDKRLQFCISLLKETLLLDVQQIEPLGYEKGHPFPYNNFAYLVNIEPRSSPHYLRTQHGVHEMPPNTSKVVLRLTSAIAMEHEGFNNECRTENEVAMLHLARNAVENTQVKHLLPRVFAWNPSNAGQQGWIIMEYMRGERLSKSFPEMDLNNQRTILEQMADILLCLQRYHLPETIGAYGGVAFDSEGNVISSQMLTIDGGPFSTYDALIEQMIRTRIQRADTYPRLDGWRNKGIKKRLDNFLETEVPRIMKKVALRNKVLVHGDLVIDNLLYDSGTMRLTAVLDFDFAHVGTVADEFFRSLGRGIGLFQDPREGSEVVPLYQAMLAGFPTPLPVEVGHTNWPAAKAWDDAIRSRHIYRPGTIPGMVELSGIYWLESQLVPFKIVNPVVVGNSAEELLAHRKSEARICWTSSFEKTDVEMLVLSSKLEMVPPFHGGQGSSLY